MIRATEESNIQRVNMGGRGPVHIISAFLSVMLCFAAESLTGRSYYISLKGSDNGSGFLSDPWQTIDKVNHSEFLPGDSILFEGGRTFNGTIHISGSGNPSKSILVSSYNSGRAIINAGNRAGISIDKASYIEIRNLVIRGSGRLTGNTENGVLINNCYDILIDNLEISGFQHSGLKVNGSGKNIRLTCIYAHENGFAGIHVIGIWPGKYDMRNVYIGHCKAGNNPGDPTVLDNHSGNGILVGCCDSVLIEYCEALENGWDMPRIGNGPVGIWAWNADHVTIQHCISHHNKTSEGAADGGGFDLDGGVTNSLIQYCISYENHGAGFGIFEFHSASKWENNTIRYNISADDGYGTGNTGILVWNGANDRRLLRKGYIYNNMIYNSSDGGSCISYLDQYQEDLFFLNNIFLSKGPAIKGSTDGSHYYANVYWNLGEGFYLNGFTSFRDWAVAKGQEFLRDSLVGLNLDPLLQGPGKIYVTDPDSISRETLPGFTLMPGSPLIDNGLDLQEVFRIDPGLQDIFGQPIPSGQGFDPGPYEYQGLIWTDRSVSMEEDWVRIFPNPPVDRSVIMQFTGTFRSGDALVRLIEPDGRILYDKVFRVRRNNETIYLPEGLSGLILISVHRDKKNKIITVLLD